MRPTIELVDAATAAPDLAAVVAGTTADYVAFASGPPIAGALEAVADALERFPSAVVYGDSTGVFRPVFSPIRLRSQDYLGDVVVISTAAIREVGGVREGFGRYAYDLALRLDDREVLHVPIALSEGPPARPADPRSAADRLAALDVAGEVSPGRVVYPIIGEPLVSVIIPTRGSRATVRGAASTLVVDAVRGILARSTYRNLEFVVVADDATPQAVVDELVAVAADRLTLVRWSAEFNFSAKMNRGAAHAHGDYLLLLNDDVELITPGWVEAMLGLAQQQGVGMVGALLYFEDDTIQHAGHVYRDHWAGHIGLGWEAGRDDALGSLSVDREVSGVTAACALLPVDVYWSVGGLSPVFAGNYNDVDLSLKVRAAGHSIVVTPHARLYHFESKTRDAAVAPEEIDALRGRWGTRLLLDPYWP